MSNSVVGTTYQAIIAKVIEASETDFLENGVDQALLEELRTGWQKRLTELKGAHYPWDPPPVVAQNPPTVPSNVPKDPVPIASTNAQQSRGYNGAHIKQEVKEEGSYSNGLSAHYGNPPQQQAYSSGLDRNMAAQRAASLLQRDFGPQAAQSIAALPNQNNITLPGQQQRPSHIQLPPNGQPQRPQQHQMPQRPQQTNVYQAQTDGAGDYPMELWSDHVSGVRAQGPEGQHEADRVIRQQVADLADRMDSGLMVPLDELPASRRHQLKKAARARARVGAASEASSSSTPRIAQSDGMESDDEKVADDEAINSDLDDSDDGLGGDDEDSLEIGDTMLCTYDKVQRVKNKWKCTLKDGILTTGGKDYLFHKATGEYEW